MIITPDNTLQTQYEFATANPEEFNHPALVGGFGSGKTEGIPLRWLQLIEYRAKQKVKCNLMVTEPTFGMIRDILIPTFDLYFDRHKIKHVFHKSFYNYTISYRGYQFTALLRSVDKPSSITGKSLTDIIGDEHDKISSITDQKEIWNEYIARVRQADYGTVSVATTPEGFKHTYELWGKALQKGFKLITAKTPNNKFLPKSYIENLYRQYSPELVKQYINGEFINLTQGKVYYPYNRNIHKRKLEFNPFLPIRLSFDFNVNPMTTSVVQIQPENNPKYQSEVVRVFKAINTANSNTDKQCMEVKKQISGLQFSKMIIYGDATNPRSTTSNRTNHEIIKSHFPDAEYKVDRVNPPITDRINSVNSKFINSLQQIGIEINSEGCEKLEEDFEKMVWKEGKNEIDTSNKALTHNSDNIGYLVWQEFPLRHKVKTSLELR